MDQSHFYDATRASKRSSMGAGGAGRRHGRVKVAIAGPAPGAPYRPPVRARARTRSRSRPRSRSCRRVAALDAARAAARQTSEYEYEHEHRPCGTEHEHAPPGNLPDQRHFEQQTTRPRHLPRTLMFGLDSVPPPAADWEFRLQFLCLIPGVSPRSTRRRDCGPDEGWAAGSGPPPRPPFRSPSVGIVHLSPPLSSH